MIARAALVLLSMALVIASAGSAEPELTVIIGAVVIDCTGGPPLIDGVVVIEGVIKLWVTEKPRT